MASRFSIDAVFHAIDKFSQPVDRMMRKVGSFAKAGDKSIGKLNAGFNKMTLGVSKKVDRALVGGVVAASAAMVVGLKQAIEEGAQFEQTMINAGTKFPGMIKQGTAEFDALRQAAMKTGATTEFTAKQAADGIMFMAMAGADAQTAMRSLAPMTDLATAAQLDLGRAMDISSDAVTILGAGLKDTGDDVQNLANLNDKLVVTANQSNQTMEQLFEATQAGGSGFISFGQNADIFLAATDVLAAAGTKGGKAGTDLQRIVGKLSAPTAEAAKKLRKIKFQPFTRDDRGRVTKQLKTFDVMIGDLAAKTSKMSKDQRAVFLKPIVGERGIDTISKLLDAGPEALLKYMEGIREAGGAAERSAREQRNSTLGRLKAMESTFQSLKLAAFDVLQDDLDGLIGQTTEWGRANKEAIGLKLKAGLVLLKNAVSGAAQGFSDLADAAKWVGGFFGDGATDVEKWSRNLVIAAGAIWGIDKAMKAVQLTMKVLVGLQWAYNFAVTSGIPGLKRFVSFLRDAPGALNKMGPALSDINTPMQRFGTALGLTAAAWAGWKIGAKINEMTQADDRLASLLQRVTGLQDELDRASRKAARRKFATGLDEQIAQTKEDLEAEIKATKEGGFFATLTGATVESAREAERLTGDLRRLEKQKASLDLSEAETSKIFAAPKIAQLPEGGFKKGAGEALFQAAANQFSSIADSAASRVTQGARGSVEFMPTESRFARVVTPTERAFHEGGGAAMAQGPERPPTAEERDLQAEMLAEMKKVAANQNTLELTISDKDNRTKVSGGSIANAVQVRRSGAL